MNSKKTSGFTLIELMVTVAIVGILAAIALPAYTKQIQKSARRLAQAQMLDLSNREQQYLLANRGYASYAQLTSAGYNLPTELTAKYTPSINVGSSTPPSFTITFQAIGNQVSDGDLTFTSEGVKGCNPACSPVTLKW
ncbi:MULTISPECIES: type IV pilin protein [Ramlibacter]|uniref:Prepilin-type N-terminal cleavage/methylation domain-containing protein n=1 Tax=Ramlibacter aquaticus TaxID=2780094 RepID=A0ABR9SI40_9BURK|nr:MULTISPECIES: type IV pilin protein [Ramlibacter]MBE7941973.1 prepilin-type N-terminal cleavage/methylation domain-containing protein [Ramlibacter aquaticus]